MVVIQLGEDVRSVRQKIGMDANDYLFLWRSMNVSPTYGCYLCADLMSVGQSARNLSKNLRSRISEAG